MKKIFLVLFIFIFANVYSNAYKNDFEMNSLIPIEELFANPDKASPKLSPDGTKIAYLSSINNISNIWLKSIYKDDDYPITNNTKQDIYNITWVNNNLILYLQDNNGDGNYHLYCTNVDKKKSIDLTPFPDTQVNICAINNNFPDEVLIALNKDHPKLKDVYNLNLKTGKLTLIEKNPGNIIQWIANSQFKICSAISFTDDGGLSILIRNNEYEKWDILLTRNFEDASFLQHSKIKVFISQDNKYFYFSDSDGSDHIYFAKIDLSTRKKEIIAQDSDYDLNNIFPGFVSFNATNMKFKILDSSIKEEFQYIQKLRTGNINYFNRDQNNKLWIIGFNSDTEPTTYFLYNRITKESSLLFETFPSLKKYKLSPMEPISFTSRDGLTIHGYITYPLKKSSFHLPMVLLVHEGPRARDSWGYNPEVQWLANRGYVCLQINYRGSTGYGKKFFINGCKEYAGKMHDDLIDAVNWAIENNIADPQKIAIYGGSYGGFAALVGATFTPDHFCCAIDKCGFSDFLTHTEYTINKSLGYEEYKWKGNPETEKIFLQEHSPFHKAKNIKIPILIAHGKNDCFVELSQAKKIIEEIKKQNTPYEFIEFPDEGHFFSQHKYKNKLIFYKKAEEFLINYLYSN